MPPLISIKTADEVNFQIYLVKLFHIQFPNNCLFRICIRRLLVEWLHKHFAAQKERLDNNSNSYSKLEYIVVSEIYQHLKFK